MLYFGTSFIRNNCRTWMTLFMNLLQDFRDVALLSSNDTHSFVRVCVWLIYIYLYSHISIGHLPVRTLQIIAFLLHLFVSSLLAFMALMFPHSHRFVHFYSFDTKFSILALRFECTLSLHSNKQSITKQILATMATTTASALANDIFWLDFLCIVHLTQCCFIYLVACSYRCSSFAFQVQKNSFNWTSSRLNVNDTQQLQPIAYN